MLAEPGRSRGGTGWARTRMGPMPTTGIDLRGMMPSRWRATAGGELTGAPYRRASRHDPRLRLQLWTSRGGRAGGEAEPGDQPSAAWGCSIRRLGTSARRRCSCAWHRWRSGFCGAKGPSSMRLLHALIGAGFALATGPENLMGTSCRRRRQARSRPEARPHPQPQALVSSEPPLQGTRPVTSCRPGNRHAREGGIMRHHRCLFQHPEEIRQPGSKVP